MKLFNSFFNSKPTTPEEEQQKNRQKNFDILKYDGMRAQRMGRTDYAIKCFQEALSLQEDFETLGYLAQTYLQTNHLNEAHKLLEHMAQLEPTHLQTFLNLAHVDYLLEDYHAMAEAAQKAISLEAGNARAHYLLGLADKRQNNDLMCIAHLTQAITLQEDFTEARLLRAETLVAMKQYKEAIEDLNEILKHTPEEEDALLLQGQVKEALGDTEGAEADYRKVTEQNPFNEQAYLKLGQLYINQKKLAEAITLFDEAIELNPNFTQAYHERGRAKLLNGDKNGATEDLKKELELNPQESENFNGQYNNQPTGIRQTDILGL